MDAQVLGLGVILLLSVRSAARLFPHFLSYRTILVAFFAVFIVPQHGYAGGPLPGQVTFGFGGSDQEVTESVDTLFPLYAPKDSLFFFNPKLTVSDELDPRVSVGLGYRQLFEEPQIILGANVFYYLWETQGRQCEPGEMAELEGRLICLADELDAREGEEAVLSDGWRCNKHRYREEASRYLG